MDYSSAPVPSPVSEPNDKTLKDFKLIDICTFISALVLFATFIIAVTRFRLWHANKFLKKLLELVNQPVFSLIQQSIGYAAAYLNQDDLFLIWVVILLLAYDNVFTISCYSLLERASYRWSREFTFLYNCIIILVMITKYKSVRQFHPPLLVLVSLVLAKFLIRIVSFGFAESAYGLENINLVAEYMKSEHKLTQLSNEIDPTCMKGYKYLVIGEKIKPMTEAQDYSAEVELTDDVVTVERVWSCKMGLLHPSVDTDGAIKDVCLSFALFKLLRRRHFGYPAAEAHEPKTKKLIFEGLLSENGDKERVFRVIKMELGFLRDLIFTRYPVGFACGFPVLNLILLLAMIGVTIWFAFIAYEKKDSYQSLFFGSHNIDYALTNSLLILLILMDLFEVLTYVFCDWTRVMMICRNVKCNSSVLDTNQWGSSDSINPNKEKPWHLFAYKVLALLFCKKPGFSLSVKSNLGQYSLLRNCRKTCFPWDDLISIIGVSKMKVLPPGVKKGKAVPLTKEVKRAIFDTLVQNQGDLTDGMATLNRNRSNVYEDLKGTLNLATPVHTIMVWHIATSLCENHQENVQESIKSNLTVATHLSNYCAYLVAFRPELLPITRNLVKHMFREIVKETSEFFDKEHNLKAKCNKLMNSRNGGQKIIHQGSKLAHDLIQKVPDDAQRWKLMADFWSEYILYIAPSGCTTAHIEQLSNGSEFITHLWALLYHAGIIDNTSEEYHP